MLTKWATDPLASAPGANHALQPESEQQLGPGYRPLPLEQWPHQPYPIYQQADFPQQPSGAMSPSQEASLPSRTMAVWIVLCSSLTAVAAGAALIATTPAGFGGLRGWLHSVQALVSTPGSPSRGRAGANFDCEAEYSTWKESWSTSKQEWCCREHERGCPSPSTEWTDSDCSVGYNSLADYAEGWSKGQQEFCCKHFDRVCPRPRVMSFYMYRAQSDANYPMENVNMADLPGVMWYLHNEVVVSTPRKYNVTRILRFKVTVRNTEEIYTATKRQFGNYVAFDKGMCTVPHCDHIWEKYGFVVGCQPLNVSMQNYVPFSDVGCDSKICQSGSWYSLPGHCPSAHVQNKSGACRTVMPGGACRTGAQWGLECTYITEPAGEIRLDDLVGIANYTKFRYNRSYFEYNATSDRGRNFTWWDGRHDQANCTWRMEQVKEMFETLYPTTDPVLRDGEPPPCWA